MGDGRRRGKRREEKRREMRLCHVKKEQEETLSEENGGEAGEGAINLSRKRVSGHYIRQAEREAAIKGKESQKKTAEDYGWNTLFTTTYSLLLPTLPTCSTANRLFFETATSIC